MVIKVQKDGQWIKIPYLTTDVAVGEAPKDGKQYARQDGTWSEVVIPEVDLSGVEADIVANTTAISANTTAIATKVDKVIGKQLSTNDYTTEEKTKLEDIPTPNSIVTTNDNRLTLATASKSGLMSGEQFQKLEKTTPDEYIKNVILTQAEYDALGNMVNSDNKLYFIKEDLITYNLIITGDTTESYYTINVNNLTEIPEDTIIIITNKRSHYELTITGDITKTLGYDAVCSFPITSNMTINFSYSMSGGGSN